GFPFELRARRTAVGQRARGSELHQPAARRATLLHLARQELRHVAFALPRRQLRERRGDRRLGDVDGAPDQDDFLGRFDDPQPFGHGRAVHGRPPRQPGRQRRIRVVTGGGIERDHATSYDVYLALGGQLSGWKFVNGAPDTRRNWWWNRARSRRCRVA